MRMAEWQTGLVPTLRVGTQMGRSAFQIAKECIPTQSVGTSAALRVAGTDRASFPRSAWGREKT